LVRRKFMPVDRVFTQAQRQESSPVAAFRFLHTQE
jgi:hypothetical protein